MPIDFLDAAATGGLADPQGAPDGEGAPRTSCRVLGIAGPSCSGKSTVSKIVAAARGARLLHLDAFWIRGSAKPLVLGHPSYERPEQYDGRALARRVAQLAEEDPGTRIVAEGFVLFAYPAMMAACGVRVFLDLAESDLLARRAARAAAAGDHTGGGKRAKAERAWLANGMDEWRRYGAAQSALPGVVRIDAGRPPERVAGDILAVWR